MATPYKILVKYATRGRKERFFEGLETIYTLCANPELLRVLITADEDDSEMNTEEVKKRISQYKNAHVSYGLSNNKIHACNKDFELMPEEWKDWDIVANFSDDMRWTVFGWDEMIRADFDSKDLSYYIAYRDPDTHGALSTLYIAGREWYDCFGFIYDNQFQSLFCDNLVEDCAKKLGKYYYTEYSIYKHLNPCYGYFPEDFMFRQQQDIGWDIDQKLYNKIIEEGIENYLKQFNL